MQGGIIKRRHRCVIRFARYDSLTKPAIRRLARRGGVKRISGDRVYEAAVQVPSRLARGGVP